MEIWTKAFENDSYEVSNLGRVKSFNKQKKKKDFQFQILKPVLNKRGYHMINIGGKLQKLCRLILKSFTSDSNLQVNHKNGIKTDDRLENLEWCTASENILHAYRTNLMNRGSRHHKSKLSEKQVKEIFQDKRSERIIAKDYGVSQINVNRIKRKIIWAHIWGS